MNFTREPIIETIITPKEGYKLVVQSSKGSGEEFAVDAVEVVSFGNALFFRSQERPKPFLVPISDFQVVEAKETRVVLKNASFDRSIKIGGGKEGSMKASKEKEEQPEVVEQRLEKKRERRRHRRRRTAIQEVDEEGETVQPASEEKASEGGGAKDETIVSSSPVSRLIPPPPGLISDKFPKVKPEEAAAPIEGDVLPQPVEESDKPAEEKPKRGRKRKKAELEESIEPEKSEETPPPAAEEPPQPEEGGELHRVSLNQEETVTSTSFSTLDPFGSDPFGKIW